MASMFNTNSSILTFCIVKVLNQEPLFKYKFYRGWRRQSSLTLIHVKESKSKVSHSYRVQLLYKIDKSINFYSL